jgi:hypothetical protein
MLKTRLYPLLMLAVFIPPSVLANNVCEIWSYKATTSPGCTSYATWNFTDGEDPGYMTGKGSSQNTCGGAPTYNLAAYIIATGEVSIQRTGSSDGNDCFYSGKKSGNSVSGTYSCTNGTKNTAWTAVIATCNKK